MSEIKNVGYTRMALNTCKLPATSTEL